MHITDIRLQCQDCGKKLGVITMLGSPTSLGCRCVDCSLKFIKEHRDQITYSDEIVNDIEAWLKEETAQQ